MGVVLAGDGEIRLSTRLRIVPDWVLDAVLVHKLAHLHVADRSARFRELAERHPRQADAELSWRASSSDSGWRTRSALRHRLISPGAPR